MKFLKKYFKNTRLLFASVMILILLPLLILQAACCFDIDYDFFKSSAQADSATATTTAAVESETAETVPEETTPLTAPELSIISKLKVPGQAIDVKAFGGYAYLTNDLGVLYVIDIRNKQNPQITGKCQGINAANIVILAGEYAYISYTEWISNDKDNSQTENGMPAVYSVCGFKIVDIKDKKNPEVVGDYISGKGSEKSVQGLVIEGDYAYLNTTDYTGDALKSKLEIVNIKDKTNPKITGYCDIEGQPNGIFVQNGYAYINNTYYDFDKKQYSGQSRFFTVDISDKEKPSIAGSCSVPANSWSVYAREKYAYLTSSIYDEEIDDYKDSTLQIVNISDAKNPAPEGKTSIPGGAWEIDMKDDFLFVSNNEGGVSVINISEPGSPAITTSLVTNGNSYDIAIDGDYGYIADGFNGLLIIGIQKKEPGEGMIVQDGQQGANIEPVASINIYGDRLSGNVFSNNNPVYLSAEDSYDPEHGDLFYTWHVNGIEVTDINNRYVMGDYIDDISLRSEMTEEKSKVTFIFENPGIYEVKLTVSDGTFESSETVQITVEEAEIIIEPLREHNFTVTIECLLLNKGDIKIKNLECYLRTPQNFSPYQVVNSIEASIPEVNEVFDGSWNLLTHFKFGENITVSKGQEFKASLTNNVTMYEYDIKSLNTKNLDYEIGDSDLKEYTGEDLFIDIDSPVIIDAVKKAAGSETDPVIKAKKIYNYIASKLYYDFPRAEDRGYEFMSASEILKIGKGVCADYAILYVAMLRAAGIPSRVAAGIPAALILREENQEIDIGHAWVEVKLPGYGWIPVDITQEDGFMGRDYYMNLATEKGTSFLYESMTMDWSSYYYDGFKYKWDGAEAPDIEQKLIYKVRDISWENLYSR